MLSPDILALAPWLILALGVRLRATTDDLSALRDAQGLAEQLRLRGAPVD